MHPLLILIPPSEGKIPNGNHPALGTLSKDVKAIYDRLQTYKGKGEGLYGVKGKALLGAQEVNANVSKAPTMPAIGRYSGVVYDGINYATLPKKAQEFFNRHVRIVSALFGLLKPQDLIPNYKLKIEKLDAAKFWRPLIAEKLQNSLVVDLLPQSHQKAVEYKEGMRVDFIVYKGSKSSPAGHQGKLIKGKFIRFLCLNGISDPKDFVKFKEDGFQFDGANFIKKL